MAQLSNLANVVAALDRSDAAGFPRPLDRVNNDRVPETVFKKHSYPGTLPLIVPAGNHVYGGPSPAVISAQQQVAQIQRQASQQGHPLTESEVKRQKRLLRNRISAKMWRNKKRARMEELERTVAHIGRIHTDIAKQVYQLIQQNKAIRDMCYGFNDGTLAQRIEDAMAQFPVDVKGLSMRLAMTISATTASSNSHSPDSVDDDEDADELDWTPDNPMPVVTPPSSAASMPRATNGPDKPPVLVQPAAAAAGVAPNGAHPPSALAALAQLASLVQSAEREQQPPSRKQAAGDAQDAGSAPAVEKEEAARGGA